MATQAVGHDGAGAEHRAGRDDAIIADDAIAEDDGFHAEEGAVADAAAVDDCAMADGNVIADVEGFAGVAMQDAMFLDVGAIADANGGDIAAGDGLKPEGAVVADGDVATDDGVGGLPVVGDAFHAGVGAEVHIFWGSIKHWGRGPVVPCRACVVWWRRRRGRRNR